MVTVFLVSKSKAAFTRLFLPETAWGEAVLGRIEAAGYTISVYEDQTQFPDPRDAVELARRDALLALADPLEG